MKSFFKCWHWIFEECGLVSSFGQHLHSLQGVFQRTYTFIYNSVCHGRLVAHQHVMHNQWNLEWICRRRKCSESSVVTEMWNCKLLLQLNQLLYVLYQLHQRFTSQSCRKIWSHSVISKVDSETYIQHYSQKTKPCTS